MDALLNCVWEHVCNFLSFFWSVFSFWALWQLCDFGLSRLKVKLRKPWVVEQKESLPEEAETVQ